MGVKDEALMDKDEICRGFGSFFEMGWMNRLLRLLNMIYSVNVEASSMISRERRRKRRKERNFQ